MGWFTSKNERLAQAVRDGNIVMVRMLLDRGADVDRSDWSSYTPLMCASFRGHLAVVKELVKHGAAVHAVNYKRRTALHFAAYAGHADVVNELVKHAPWLNITDDWGYSPLYSASSEGHLEAVKALVQHGANINFSTTHDAWTSLHAASYNGNWKLAEWLLAMGADLAMKTKSGHTARDFAMRKDHTAIVLAIDSRAPLAIDTHACPPATISTFAPPFPPSPPASPRRGPACVVCYDLEREAVCVPCGHHALCMACAGLLLAQQPPTCPVCRGHIREVVRVHCC